MSLVFALTLLCVSETVALDLSCRPGACPPGHYRKSRCGLDDGWNLCEECPEGRFMNLNNTERSCIQCKKCEPRRVEQTPCSSVSDRQCVVKSPGCSSCKNGAPELTPGSRSDSWLYISETVALDRSCRPGACPPGHYRKSRCGLNDGWNLCEECPEGRFMNLNNTERSCIQCKKCEPKRVEQTPCSSVSDRQCVVKSPGCSSCKNGAPELTPGSRIVDCNPECRVLQPTSPGSKEENSKTTAAAADAVTAAAADAVTAAADDVTQGRDAAPIHQAAGVSPLLWVLLIFLTLPFAFCLRGFFLKKRNKNLHLDGCSGDTEDPLQTETERLQSRTTLNFTIFEETPKIDDVMGPAPPENPTRNPQVEHRGFPEQTASEPFPAIVLYAVIKEIPLRRWKELMRLLSVGDRQLERVEVDVGLSSTERQYQQLRLWSQKPDAKMDDVYSTLRHMELAGCAQMIRESLEHMHLKPQLETAL